MIANLQAKDYKGFTGGKNTLCTLVETPLEACLVARDCQLGADGWIRKRPGYTFLQQALAGQVGRIFDYQRQSDDTQRVLVSGNGLLIAIDPSAVKPPVKLSSGLQQAVLDFVGMLAIAYASNGSDAVRLINNAGVEKVYNWGIAAPGVAPALAVSAGTLNLTYGRQYVYSYVSIITDSNGTPWLSVSAPSPISASSGPVVNSVVTLSDLTASADPQVTHKWIFATVDTPLNSTSAFYFAAEIANATTSWGDTLSDDALDTTRQAPWDNLPAPAAQRILEYQSRIAAVGIGGKPDLVQLSGFEEIDLGVPQESWPPDLAFQVPGGTQALTGAVVFANSLMLSTADYWFSLSGFDAQTFTKQDKVAQPGAVGFEAVDTTPTHLIWISRDKKFWAWDGVTTPLEMSLNTRTQLAGTLSMEDLNSATLEKAVLKYFSYGSKHLVLLLANTSGVAGPGFDWIMAWDLDAQGAPQQQSEVQQAGRAAQWDMFPGDYMSAAGVVDIDGARSLWLGDPEGNLYAWPSGWTDNGKLYRPVYGTPFHHLGLQSAFFNQGPSALAKRLYWLDLTTDREDAATAFDVKAVVGDGVSMVAPPVGLPSGPLRSGYGVDPSMLRAVHNQPGSTVGRWARWFFIFPMDDQPAAIAQYTPSFAPLYEVNP